MKRHWRRLALQMGILLSMILVEAISEDLFVALVSLSIIVFPVATWTVFGILLWTASKAPDIESLNERVDDALSAAMGSTVAAVLGLLVFGRLIHVITFQVGPIITVGLAFILVTQSVPAMASLKTWRDIWLPMLRKKGKFGP